MSIRVFEWKILGESKNALAKRVRHELHQIFLECMGLENVTISDNQVLEDLGIDSLDKIELIVEAEDFFGIQIADADGDKILTFGEFVECVLAKRPPKK